MALTDIATDLFARLIGVDNAEAISCKLVWSGLELVERTRLNKVQHKPVEMNFYRI